MAWMLIIVAVLSLAGGLMLLARQARLRREADLTRTWPEVEGVILDSWVEDVGDAGHPLFEPRVRYTYRVGERTLSGTRILDGATCTRHRGYAAGVIERYIRDWGLMVHHDPADPTHSVLEHRQGGSLAGIVLGVLLVLLSPMIAGLGLIMV